MDEKFNMFMETVDERFRGFVNQINEYLTENGCKCDIKLHCHTFGIGNFQIPNMSLLTLLMKC